MNIVIFTSNSTRHKFIANELAHHVERALVVVECKPLTDTIAATRGSTMTEHFRMRDETESEYFGSNTVFNAPTLPLLYKEVNTPFVYETLKDFNPDAAFVFGSSIIKEPVLSLIPTGRFINMHLGLSPYYRGSGTNFWPFVNEELEYVGATLLHIDAGIDTGDIVAHVRPTFETDDTVHSAGCKTIQDGAKELVRCLETFRTGGSVNRVKQWKASSEKYYKNADFTERILCEYLNKLDDNLVDKYLASKMPPPKLVVF